MPSPLKIGLFTRYHSETPCKVCPKQSAAYPERRNRSSRNSQPQRIQCGLYHDITPEQPCEVLCSQSNGDQYRPERSHKTGAACHGQPAPDFSRLSGQGIVQPVQCSPVAMQGSAFCGFSALNFPNCAKCLFVEVHKTTKTAYLLAFCKYAVFQTNFCRQFLTDYCDLYGL